MYFVILRSDCNSYKLKQVKLGDDHRKKILYSGMLVMTL